MDQALVTKLGEVAARAAKKMRAISQALSEDDLVENFDAYLVSVDLSTLCVSIKRAALCWVENPGLRSMASWEGVLNGEILALLYSLLNEDVGASQISQYEEGLTQSVQPLLDALVADPKISSFWPRYTHGGDRI